MAAGKWNTHCRYTLYRRGTAKGSDASAADADDYYNVENSHHTNDGVTSSTTYQQLTLPKPFDSIIYSQLTPPDNR